MTRVPHPDDGLVLRRAQVLAPAMDALAILDWINDRPALYFGTIDAAVLAACDSINGLAAPFYAGGREVEHGPVTENGTIRSLAAMEKAESPGRCYGVARRVPSYGAPYPIEHPEV